MIVHDITDVQNNGRVDHVIALDEYVLVGVTSGVHEIAGTNSVTSACLQL